MKLKTVVLVVLMSMTVAIATAADPVAVRVDVEPLSFGEGGTRVAVTVQVAPEDRGRIGRNAMVRIELDGAAPPGESPLWAVRMADDGSGRVDTVWPPGEHTLRLEISDPSGQDSGLWVGTVRIPGVVEGRSTAASSDAPTPTSDAPVDVDEPVAEAAEAVVDTGDPRVAEAAGPTEVAGAEPDAAADAAEPGAAAAPSPLVGDEGTLEAPPPGDAVGEASETPASPVRELAEAPAAPAAAAAAGAAETVVLEPSGLAEAPPTPAIAEAPELRDEAAPAAETEAEAPPVTAGPEAPATTPEPSTRAASADSPAPSVAPAPEPVIEPETAVVEPLRPAGAAPAPTSGTEPPPKAERDAGPPAAEVAAAYSAWSDAAHGSVELTAVVQRGREPAAELTRSDLELRLGGRQVAIDAVGGFGSAPLLLGIAVDAAADAGIGWPGAGGRLAALAERAAPGRGRTFYAAPGVGVAAWDAGPPAAAPSSTSGDVANLIADSLARFEGTQGRRVLLLITDGASEPDKDAWQRAVDAAAVSGTPVLIVALWDEDFGRRVRNRLREVVDASGGSLFMVQGRPQLDRAVERFGPLLDAAVSLRFTVPAGVELPADVRLEAAAPGLEISAPKRVR